MWFSYNPSIFKPGFIIFPLIVSLGPEVKKPVLGLWPCENIYRIPTGALSDVLKDVLKFLLGSHVICYLAQDLMAWGLPYVLNFTWLSVSVFINMLMSAALSLSHIIWKYQFWWWRALISLRQANENTGKWDFGVICPSGSLALKHEVLIWAQRGGFRVTASDINLSFLTCLDGKLQWFMSWEMNVRRIEEMFFWVGVTSCWFSCNIWKKKCTNTDLQALKWLKWHFFLNACTSSSCQTQWTDWGHIWRRLIC